MFIADSKLMEKASPPEKIVSEEDGVFWKGYYSSSLKTSYRDVAKFCWHEVSKTLVELVP